MTFLCGVVWWCNSRHAVRFILNLLEPESEDNKSHHCKRPGASDVNDSARGVGGGGKGSRAGPKRKKSTSTT